MDDDTRSRLAAPTEIPVEGDRRALAELLLDRTLREMLMPSLDETLAIVAELGWHYRYAAEARQAVRDRLNDAGYLLLNDETVVKP